MPSEAQLKPTLWRTCRAIANRRRLRLFGWLVRHPDQSVSEAARQLRLPLSLTSLYLRSLEGRGLLTARRVSRFVKYRPVSAENSGPASRLAGALTAAFEKEANPSESIFRLATAFTHPRRVELFRVLQTGPGTAHELRLATGASGWALLRHLRKLQTRGFIVRCEGTYVAVEQPEGVRRELAVWAARKD